MNAVEEACRRVTLESESGSESGSGAAAGGTLYDCRGRASELALAGA
jgi:hypothetical protein